MKSKIFGVGIILNPSASLFVCISTGASLTILNGALLTGALLTILTICLRRQENCKCFCFCINVCVDC